MYLFQTKCKLPGSYYLAREVSSCGGSDKIYYGGAVCNVKDAHAVLPGLMQHLQKVCTWFRRVHPAVKSNAENNSEVYLDSPTDNELEVFENLKIILANPRVLSSSKRWCPYMVDTYAKKYAPGAVLTQEQEVNVEVSSEKQKVIVGFRSNHLIVAERNYCSTERKFNSVFWAFKTLRPYVEGTQFVLRSDHDSLRWIISVSEPHGRLTRWRLRLSKFDFTVVYRRGLKNQVPDAL